MEITRIKTFTVNKPVTINTKDQDKKTFIDFREDGTHSFICRDEETVNKVAEAYGRLGEPVVLRIFHKPIDRSMNPETYIWGKELLHPSPFTSTLGAATRIQNIAAFEGLAPRVYAIVLLDINGTFYPAQLVESVGDSLDANLIYGDREEVYMKVDKLCRELGIEPPFGDLGTVGNVIGGKWVDWQGCRFTPAYEEGLKERVVRDGMFGDHMYQTVPELGVKGLRDTLSRPKDLGFDKINWEGATVHDCGCSSGAFCEYAVDAGARRVTGTDHGHVIRTTRELSNYKGYFNIDYIGMDINSPQNIGKFDITLFLSMYRHVRLPQWVDDSTKKVFLFELNKPDDMTKEEVIKDVVSRFDSYIQLDNNKDFHDREIFICTRNS